MERTDYLKSSVEKYVDNEMKSLKDLKDNLDLEVTNIQSNADLMEKNLDDGTKWEDVELMDCKDIFIKMMDWIRNYDTSSEEYSRKIRFTCHDGVNDLARRILEIGDLKMQENNPKSNDDFESRSTGLSRSKSDHRLVSQFRNEEASSPTRTRRAFGYSREANKSRSNLGRYGGEEEDDEGSRSSRFSSRFLRGQGDDDSSDDRRNSRHLEEEPMTKKERNKVIETEDASRGPLSGCIRLADSSRVIQRLKEHEMELARPKKKSPSPKAEAKKPEAPRPAPRPVSGVHGQCTPGVYDARLRTLKDGHDDEEIDKIKAEIKEAAKKDEKKNSTTAAPSVSTPAAPAPKPTPTPAPAPAPTPAAPARRPEPAPAPTPAPAPVAPARRSSATPSEPPTPAARKNSTSVAPSATSSMRPSRATSPNSIVSRYTTGHSMVPPSHPPAQEASPDSDFSDSSDSSSDTSSDDDDEPETVPAGNEDDDYEYYYDDEDETPALAPVQGPHSILKKPTTAAKPTGATTSSYSPPYSAQTTAEHPSRNSSAYGGATTSSGYGTSQSSGYGGSTGYGSSSRQQPPEPEPRASRAYGGSRTTSYYGDSETTTAPLSPTTSRRYGRYSSPGAETSSSLLSERRQSREDSSDSGAGRYQRKRDDSDSFVSRYLAKSRTSGTLTADQKEPSPDESASRRISGELQYPSGRSRYAALKEQKARLAKSKSSAMIGLGAEDDDEDDGEEILTPFTSRFGGELARSRSSHMLKDQSSPTSSGTSGSRQVEGNEQDENLSSWAKYLKNKYGGIGGGAGPGGGGGGGSPDVSSREKEKEERRAR